MFMLVAKFILRPHLVKPKVPLLYFDKIYQGSKVLVWSPIPLQIFNSIFVCFNKANSNQPNLKYQKLSLYFPPPIFTYHLFIISYQTHLGVLLNQWRVCWIEWVYFYHSYINTTYVYSSQCSYIGAYLGWTWWNEAKGEGRELLSGFPWKIRRNHKGTEVYLTLMTNGSDIYYLATTSENSNNTLYVHYLHFI